MFRNSSKNGAKENSNVQLHMENCMHALTMQAQNDAGKAMGVFSEFQREAMDTKQKLVDLEDKLATSGEKVIKFTEEIDSRLLQTEELLKTESALRGEMAERVANIIREKEDDLIAMLAEEREERKLREQMSQQMVENVAGWMSFSS